MTQLPTGIYQSGSSVIHEMNAAVKIVCLFLLIFTIVAADSVLSYLVVISFTLAVIYLAQISFKSALAPAGRLLWFFSVIFLMNLFFYSPENPWFSWWIFSPSAGGLIHGITVVLRVMLILLLSNVLTSTTTPLRLSSGMETLLKPLSFLKIPTEQIAMILSVSIQFIPTIFDEADMIRKAQQARGARFDSRNYFEKAAAAMPLVVPVFISAFKRADELSLAMEARGYRTGLSWGAKKKEKLSLKDYGALLVCASVLAAQLVIF
ncbi:MAG: energy-coupling factor transporter transmembrane component T family protein [Candidatus Limivicinus sp.]|jgi:energy-coupling factor transport system permease protein